ncbi:MAG: ABC transporter ATP-binding protein [Treponemataceae bacterium]
MSDYAIEMQGITKSFPGILANDNIHFQVKKNEVMALLGENGSGKSTLMSILFGSYDADSGTIKINGKEVPKMNPNMATELGIGMVHQHFKLVHNYSVTENIVLGLEPKNKFGFIDLKKAEKRVEQLSKKYGLQVNPSDRIEDISIGMQQRVEILKTLYRNADIIIFDEPTAVLTPQEIDELMDIIKQLQNEGKTIIIITHKLKEIKAVAQRCTILRQGKLIDTVTVASVSEHELAEKMVGRAVKFEIDKIPANPKDVVLSVQNISVKNSRGQIAVNNLSFDVKAGEIVGIAGIDGNGQTELIYAITGLVPLQSGKILLNSKDISSLSIRQRIHAGIGHIPEDRQKHGLIGNFTIAENVVLKNYFFKPYTGKGFLLNFEKMKKKADLLIKNFDIRCAQGSLSKVASMSGGNQQKVIIAREIDLEPQFLIVAQPTRGLDVGAIEYIRKCIVEQRDKGKAIMLVSFELDEIMNLCDRIATISQGSIVGISYADKITEREIGLMMAGSQSADNKNSEVLA